MISIGVDVGAYSIKIAELEATSKSYVIRRLLEFPLSLDLTKDKKIEIIDQLRTLFQHYDHDKTQFIFSIPPKSVSSRHLSFPFRERFKVQKAVISQLEDDLPFSTEEAIFDAKIVRYRGKGAEVLALAAPKERVAEILNLAHDCGVEPLLISSDGTALANLFEKWWDPPQESPATAVVAGDIHVPRLAELILNIGHLNSQLLVYSDGSLIAVRSIDWGAKNIADQIGLKYGLNYIQGLTELQSKGFVLLDKGGATKEQVAFSQVIEGALAGLISEMRLKMLDLQSEMSLQWVKGALIGGGGELRNLGAYLTQQLEMPFNRFKQFEIHPTMNTETNPHLEMVTGVAVGLAIEGLKRPRNPAVNFLKGEFARQSDYLKSLWEKWGHTVQLAGVAFVLLMVYGVTRDSFSLRLLDESDRVVKLQAKAIANLAGAKASVVNINKFLREKEIEAGHRKQAGKVAHVNSALDILNAVSKSVPMGRDLPLEIKRFNVNGQTVEVHGYTNTPAQKARIVQAMQGISSNGRVENINPSVKAPNGKVGFGVRFQVVRSSGG